MASRHTDIPPRLLRTQEAARFLGISLRTLEKHRTYGTGPTYRKIGGRVVYAVEDLQSWSAIGARRSTSDENAGTVFPARPLTPHERRRLTDAS
jgi:predicted DNA-binding transcriptional regulator AlpA